MFKQSCTFVIFSRKATIQKGDMPDTLPPPPPPPPPAFQDWSLTYNPENNYPDSLSPPPPPSPQPAMSSMSTSSRLDEIISIRGTLRRKQKEKKEASGKQEAASNENAKRKHQYHMNEIHDQDSKDFSPHDVDDYESELNFAGVKVVMSSNKHRSISDTSNNLGGDNVMILNSNCASGNDDYGNDDNSYKNNCNNDSMVASNSKQQTTIRSHRGTVRGVRNRVRQGIATFLLKDPCLKVS